MKFLSFLTPAILAFSIGACSPEIDEVVNSDPDESNVGESTEDRIAELEFQASESESSSLEPLEIYELTQEASEISAENFDWSVFGADFDQEGLLEEYEAAQKSAAMQTAPDGRSALLRPSDRRARFVVNGVKTASYPTTGALLKGPNSEIADLQCTGTLIACDTFLTAAHCFEEEDASNPGQYVFNLDTNQYHVYFQHAGVFGIKNISYQKSAYNFPTADIALVELQATPTGMFTSPINNISQIVDNTEGVIVGFGRTGGLNEDYGIKRTGGVKTTTCKNGRNNDELVCWDFPFGSNPPGSVSNTCHGDSGGPFFFTHNSDDPYLVGGVTSGGEDQNQNTNTCLAGGHSYDASVFHYRQWITSNAFGQLGQQLCGSSPHLGDSGARVSADNGSLSPISRYRLYDVTVHEGTSRIVFAMNGETDGSGDIDFDLFVQHGSPPTASSNVCKQTGSGQFAHCEISDPKPGKWYALVTRKKGSGDFQIIASRFSPE